MLLTTFLQVHRLPFRRGHRPAVLPARVQRVGIQRAAISDDCVAVLEHHRCLMKRWCRTPQATSKQASKQNGCQRGHLPAILPTSREPTRRHILLPGSTHVTSAPSHGRVGGRALDDITSCQHGHRTHVNNNQQISTTTFDCRAPTVQVQLVPFFNELDIQHASHPSRPTILITANLIDTNTEIYDSLSPRERNDIHA
jgi:hypothetical protein